MTIPTSTGGQFVNAIGATQIPTTVSNPAVGSTMSQSATAPATPKQTYINNQVKSTAPATPVPADNNILANNAANASYFQNNPNVFGAAGQQAQANTTGSTATASPGVYNPYTSPAYQQYVQNAVTAATPAMTNPQVQQGILGANQNLENIQSNYSTNVNADLNNPALSAGSLTGLEAAEAQMAANKSVPVQTQLNLLNSQQAQGETAANIPLTAANTQAAYLGNIAQPQTVQPGQTLTTVNPSTGQTTPLASVPNYTAGTNTQTGAPYTYNQTTGAINNMGTNSGLGTTPPVLGQVIAPSDPYYSTLQTAAQLLSTNQVGAAQNIMSGMPSAVQAQVYQMAEGQGYNSNTAAGQSAAQISNAQTSGTAATNLANTIYQASGKSYSDFTTGLSKVQSLGQNVIAAMPSGTNPSDSSVLNGTIQDFDKNYAANPQYSALGAAVNNLQAQVGAMLGSGLIPSSATADAQAVISGTMPIKSMQSTINQILADGASVNAANFAQMNQAASSLGINNSQSSSDLFGMNEWVTPK